MKKLLTLSVMLILVSQLMAQTEIYSRIKINIDRSAIPGLLTLGIPVDDGFIEKDGVTLELSARELQVLSSNGYAYEVLIEDMTRYYQDRNQGFEGDLDYLKSVSSPLSREWPVPEGFELGTCGGFSTIDQFLEHLDNMIAGYPNLISEVGQLDYLSHEGREINWIRISDNPNVNEEGEPEVLYTGMHHAREAIGMQHLLFFMYHLLENYDTDPEVQYIINNFELYFIPILNIDGYAYNITTDPNGGGMWRKNRRDNGGSYGVDINRNYGHMWGIDNSGSSPVPGDETYRGPSAFSEPCNQAARDFCNEHEFQIALNYHSYSNLFLYPWGYTSTLTPDNETFFEFSKIMTKENGYTYGPGNTTIYATNGGSDDWMYGEQTTKEKILSWTPEVGNSNDGFWPQVSRIIPLCQENMWQSMMAAKLCGAYAEVQDISPLILEEKDGDLDAQIKRIGLKEDAVYTVEIIPLNDAIATIEDPIVFDDLELFVPQTASFTYSLKPDIQNGDEILYLLSCNNGYYIESDTISKIYGTPVVVFKDTAENFSNWASGKWNITGSSYHSATKSITDSPSGNYSNYENNIMTLTNIVDLGEAVFAAMNFWTKWDIEPGYDYVQVMVSADGGAYQALTGKYTKVGNSNQAPGEPVFDGTQNTWVKEEMSLQPFLGKEIKIRFRLVSDSYVTEDGFYWDDLEIVVIDELTGIGDKNNEKNSVSLMPNPAKDRVQIEVSGTLPENNKLMIYNSQGQVQYEQSLTSNKIRIDISSWSAGIYFYTFRSNDSLLSSGKLVKQ